MSVCIRGTCSYHKGFRNGLRKENVGIWMWLVYVYVEISKKKDKANVANVNFEPTGRALHFLLFCGFDIFQKKVGGGVFLKELYYASVSPILKRE